MKSTDQLGRLLTLVPYVQANPGVTAAEVAEHYGTTEAQIIRDLKVLWFCGPNNQPGQQFDFNMEAIEEGEPIVVLNGQDVRRPQRFHQGEAMALRVALVALQPIVPTEQQAVVASTLAKMEAVSGGSGAVAVQLSSGSDQIRAALADAIAAGRRVSLSYDGLSRGATSTPEVDPVEVVVRDGFAYLRGFSIDRDDWRTYRLDRIVEVVTRDEPIGEHGPLPELGSGWFSADQGHQVTLTLAPRARWVTEYDPVDDVTALDDGRVRATFQVVDEGWLALRLLQLGNGVEVVDPPEAAVAARETARTGLDLYDAIG
ncbi:helix-turn-helix transcriptional regulator [Aestuariimicrobium soli]|uniref:helix-turn-helix transcriptional regulator n=1 Tax=Aestuariimicrobium soli TaxID=2035834 RepID=UPI003EBF4473